MLNLIIAVVAILLLYGLAKKYVEVQNDKAEVWVGHQKADLQESLKELADRVKALKEKNGKWFSVKEIESEMQ